MNWMRRIRKRKRIEINPELLLLGDELILKTMEAIAKEAELTDVPFKEVK